MPRDQGEFVIVHELVYLLCPDARHGRLFENFMLAYLPDWEQRLRAWGQRPPSTKSAMLRGTTDVERFIL